MSASDRRDYWDYLKIDQLLSLQSGYGDGVSADELHFIVVHQSFELWFKLMTSELRLARDWMGRDSVEDKDLRHVVHHLRRVEEILKLLVTQFEVMETLTPQDFLEFRDKFVTGASGLQSHQMRVIETVLGLAPDVRRSVFERTARPGDRFHDPVQAILGMTEGAAAGSAGAFVHSELSRVLGEESFVAALRRWLLRTPVDRRLADAYAPNDLEASERARAYVERYIAGIERHQRETGWLDESKRDAALASARGWLLPEDPEAQRARAAILFIESNRDLALLSWARLLLDTVVAVEEQLLLWRMRHARMAERIIGRRIGTGGTAAEYLDNTIAYRIFTDLWDVRQFILPKRMAPALLDPAFYERLDFAWPL